MTSSVLSANRARALGFTLLEMMVALAILATVGLALMRAMTGGANGLASVEERQFADLVLNNIQVRLYLEGVEKESKGEAEMAGFKYKWTIDPVETDVPNFRRAEVEVLDEEGTLMAKGTSFVEVLN